MEVIPDFERISQATTASLPEGANNKIVFSLLAFLFGVTIIHQCSIGFAMINGDSGKNPSKLCQRIPYMHSFRIDTEFSNRPFMAAAPFFHNGNCLPHRPLSFKITQYEYTIG